MTTDVLETSEDAVLGGRLRLRQPLKGHRIGHDAILLAAATGGHAGEHVADLGAGVGAAGLALAARIGGLQIALVEIDVALCALAAENALLNGLDDRVEVHAADVGDVQSLGAAGIKPGSFDRVLMNPPFHDATRQHLSPDPRRRLAHAARPGLLTRWIASATWLLKPHGVLTMIWRADGLAAVQGALADGFGSIAVLPIMPRPEAPAIRVLVRAVKAVAGAAVTYPGLVLNDAQGRPSAAAEAVLRGGDALVLAKS
ncbi:MAG TPA: methyltransferase [Pseudolabrys sp.]|nr:methyltransferase [Pseudolabrys sp.]